MPSLQQITRFYLYLLSFTPLVSYVLLEFFNQEFKKIFGILAIFLIFLTIGVKGIKAIRFRWYYVIFIILYLYYMGWDITLDQGNIARKGWAYDFFLANDMIRTLCILLVIDNVKLDKKFIDRIIKIFIGTALVAVVVMMIQFLFDPFFFTPEKFIHFNKALHLANDPYQVKRISIFGYASIHDLGLSFMPIFALLIAYLIRIENKIPWVILGITLLIVFGSNVRYIQAAYFLCAIPVLYLNDRPIKNFLIGTFFMFLGLIFLVQLLSIFNFNIYTYLNERIFDKTAESRLLALQIFLEFFPQYPFFGTGEHLTEEVVVAIADRSSQIHVGYLAHLFSYGIIGSLFLFTLWYYLGRTLLQTARITKFYGAYLGFLVFIWANVTLVYYSIFMYGLIFCFVFNKYYEDRYSNVIEYSLNEGNVVKK